MSTRRLALLERRARGAEKLRLSADSRFSAISKLTRVRVEASKKRLSTVLPRSVGTFLIGRAATSAKDSAVSSTSSISAGDSSAMPSRSLRVPARPAPCRSAAQRSPGRDRGSAVLLAAVGRLEGHLDDVVVEVGHHLADEVGLDRQLAVAAVDRAPRAAPPSAVRSRSARRARRAPCGRCRARRRRAPPSCRRWAPAAGRSCTIGCGPIVDRSSR